MFVLSNDVKPNIVGSGATRKILGVGGKLMMVEVTFKKGAVGDVHKHYHEQVSYVAKGKLEFNLNGEKKVLTPGDSIYIDSDCVHGLVALEEGSVIVDIFTPQREDFLK